MATPKKSNKSDPAQIQWVSIDLSAEQTKDMKARFPDWDAVNEFLIKGIESGYKFTLSYDNRNKCYSAYLIQTDPSGTNFGCILSCRGSSPFSALRGIGYRHYVIFDTVWGERAATNIDDD